MLAAHNEERVNAKRALEAKLRQQERDLKQEMYRFKRKYE